MVGEHGQFGMDWMFSVISNPAAQSWYGTSRRWPQGQVLSQVRLEQDEVVVQHRLLCDTDQLSHGDLRPHRLR